VLELASPWRGIDVADVSEALRARPLSDSVASEVTSSAPTTIRIDVLDMGTRDKCL
jgi:hypothetical protein